MFLLEKNWPQNCNCQEFVSTCALVFCEDKLDVHPVLLTIEGRMCTEHYGILKQYPKVYKKLLNIYCSAELELCE